VANKVQICNIALQNLGATKITSITENTVEAIECNLRYDTARRALLAMHPWNFAIRRALLNANVSAPAFNYGYAYTLPSDFLALVMTRLEEQYQSQGSRAVNTTQYVEDVVTYVGVDKYRIEGGNLISYNSDVGIIYIADVEDEQSSSPHFVDLLGRYLAAQIAYKITGNMAERNAQMEIFKLELEEYRALDSQQGVFDRIEVSQFLSARM
jgi:hypothetical protein